MRLRKPNLIPQLVPTLTSSPFTTSPISHLKDFTLLDPLLEGNGLTGLAELPNGFGSMFVGTNFSAYVCLNNETDEEVRDIYITAEMRVRQSTSKTSLVARISRVGGGEGGIITGDEEGGRVSLLPHEAFHQIIDQSTSPLKSVIPCPPCVHNLCLQSTVLCC
jgi:hypothetical protein